jgi:hypothetical protein
MYGLADATTRKVERTLILIKEHAPGGSFGECGPHAIAVTMRRSVAETGESVSSSPVRFLS